MYGKLFEQMYDGTLATKGPWQALVTFQQLIILANKHGDVDMTPEAIARRTTIPLEIIQQGIAALEEPDPGSRSPGLEGRRIVRLSEHRAWGWNVVNYGHYRKMRSEDERREYMKLYQRRRREAVKLNVNMSTPGKQSQPIAVSSMQYAESNKKKEQGADAPDWLPPEWQDYEQHRKEKRQTLTPTARKQCLAKLAGWKDEGRDLGQILRHNIANGYTGLFLPNEKGNGRSVTAANIAAGQEFLRREREKDEKPAS